MSKFVSIDDNEYNKGVIPEYIKFSYELDNFQKHGCKAISENENVLATAHTGSGKTVLALYAISKALSENKQVIYTSPIKTLSNQKFKEFSELFDDVGILTGDVKINPNGKCLVMTAEILRNGLLREYNEELYEWNFNPRNVGCVILDEVHFINNKERGRIWEEIIINLSREIQLVMLSATISGSDEMVLWLGELKKVVCHLVSTKNRPVPLKHSIFWDNKLHKFLENDKEWKNGVVMNIGKSINKYFSEYRNPNEELIKCLKYLMDNNLTPATLFILSRNRIESVSKSLPRLVEDHMIVKRIDELWNKYLRKYRCVYEGTEQWSEIYNLVIKGIGIHHSGLIPVLKEIVEILYSEGLLPLLLATETFAMGVNMPTKSVIFTELTKYDNGVRLLLPEEYGQMAGRAGRRGLDKLGNVIILGSKKFIFEEKLKNIVLAPPQNIRSKFSLNYNIVLKMFSINKENEIKEIFMNSLYNEQEKKIIKSLENDLLEIETEKSKISSKVRDKLEIGYKIREIENVLGSGLMSKKKRMKILMERDNMLKDIKHEMKEINNLIEMEERCNKIREDIEYNKNKIDIQIESIIDYLNKEGMLKDNKLTRKGLIVSEMNEGNPLLIYELMENGYFEELEFNEIMGVLSLFIGDKIEEEIECDKLVSDIVLLNDELYNKELRWVQGLPIYFVNNWDLSMSMYEITKEWCNGGEWKDIRHIYKSFEGNFVKNILRLCNLVRNVENVCKLVNNVDLLNKIYMYEEKLIRDIVMIDSLYL